MARKMARILARLRDEPGLSEHERILWARSLAATPDERWQNAPELPPLAGLIHALAEEKFGFK